MTSSIHDRLKAMRALTSHQRSEVLRLSVLAAGSALAGQPNGVACSLSDAHRLAASAADLVATNATYLVGALRFLGDEGEGTSMALHQGLTQFHDRLAAHSQKGLF